MIDCSIIFTQMSINFHAIFQFMPIFCVYGILYDVNVNVNTAAYQF